LRSTEEPRLRALSLLAVFRRDRHANGHHGGGLAGVSHHREGIGSRADRTFTVSALFMPGIVLRARRGSIRQAHDHPVRPLRLRGLHLTAAWLCLDGYPQHAADFWRFG